MSLTGTAARRVAVGHSDTSGRPGALLGAASAAVSRTATWLDVVIPPVGLTSGRSVWLAILGVGGGLRFRDRLQGPCAAQTSQQTSLSGLPARWSAGAISRRRPASVYVTPLELAPPPEGGSGPVSAPPPGSQPPPLGESPPTSEPPRGGVNRRRRPNRRPPIRRQRAHAARRDGRRDRRSHPLLGRRAPGPEILRRSLISGRTATPQAKAA